MENIHLIAIGTGFAFGLLFGRFITKIKLAIIYELRMKRRRGLVGREVEVR